MKNKCKVPFVRLFGIAAIVAVIGFSMTACDDPNPPDEGDTTTAGRLPVTGLSSYNGKKILVNYQFPNGDGVYSGFAITGVNANTFIEPVINDGSVTVYMWKSTLTRTTTSDGGIIQTVPDPKSYTGNDQNVSFVVSIWDANNQNFEQVEGSVAVNFTNGIGSGAFVP
jgi:hypothetical protein